MGLNINLHALATTPSADLTSAYILSFLVYHDWEDIAPAFKLSESDKKAFAPAQVGTINLDATARTFTIDLPTINNQSQWDFQQPELVNLVNAPGTLYTAPNAPLPNGQNTFWIQQYPSAILGEVGRTVIEFYTNDIITALFKTDADNVGGPGKGEWKPKA